VSEKVLPFQTQLGMRKNLKILPTNNYLEWSEKDKKRIKYAKDWIKNGRRWGKIFYEELEIKVRKNIHFLIMP